MKFVSTAILAAGALMLLMGSQGMGPRDIEDTAIGVMIFAGAFHLIWGGVSAK